MPSLPEPRCPPIVQVGDEIVAYLLCWEQHEPDGSWHAWVTWIRYRAEVPFRHVVAVRAGHVRPLQRPDAYREVPRRIVGADLQIRAWPARRGASRPPEASRRPGPTLTRRSRELVRRRRRRRRRELLLLRGRVLA